MSGVCGDSMPSAKSKSRPYLGDYKRVTIRQVKAGDYSIAYGRVVKVVEGRSGAIRVFFDSNARLTWPKGEVDTKKLWVK